ncbi:MAG: hypothetical protein LUD15_00440 [Bacteroides sp.]|nr:hypothetical protein [Bacteroides sp.]
MSPELIYFLKVNTGIILFYLFYRIFFSKDTFFRIRRVILPGFFVISLLYPLLHIEEWTRNQEPLLEIVQRYATALLPEIEAGVQEVGVNHWWQFIPSLLFYIYLTGVIFLSIRLLIRLSGIILLNRRCQKKEDPGNRGTYP